MKRPLLILVGFVGALASILGITPPQFGQSSLLKTPAPLGNSSQTTNTGVVTQAAAKKTQAPVATPSIPSVKGSNEDGEGQDSEDATDNNDSTGFTGATSKIVANKPATIKKVTPSKTVVKKTVVKKTVTKTATPAATNTPTPTVTKTNTPVASKPSGVFTGAAKDIGYGIVQVQITVSNGKITSAKTLQQPQGGRSGQINQQAVPMLNQEVLAAQSASIQGVGGASYTSQGYQASLASAIAKAGI